MCMAAAYDTRLLNDYAGKKLKVALAKIGKWNLEIIKRSDRAKGFVLLPRRWVVERTFAWLNRNLLAALSCQD